MCLLLKYRAKATSTKYIIMPLFNTAALARLLFPLLLAVSVPSLAADDLKEVSRLISQNQNAQALDRVSSYLSDHPKDAQGLFLKGVILAELNKPNDAIRVFTDLTETHPELPEPYNNLAVLYADQGQYDKARRALEQAIKTHPSYSTAHENLGDIYAKMASDAYDKALQLDKVNARAQTKLALIKDLFSSNNGTLPPIAKTSKPAEPAKSVVTPIAVATAPAPQPKPTPTAPVAPPTVKEAAKEPAKPADKPAKETPPKVEPTPEPAKENPKESVKDNGPAPLESVRAWAKAWSAKNVEGYLDYYADSFKTPSGESRKAWEQSRRERIRKPQPIKVEVNNAKVKLDGNHATVSFQQVYRSGGDTMRTTKTLIMKKVGNRWLIEQEIAKR